MANCTKCGEPLKEDAWVCGKCGAPVALTQPKPRDKPQGYSAYYSGSAPTPPPELKATGSAQATKGGLSRSRKPPIIAIAAGLASVLAVVAVALVLIAPWHNNGETDVFEGTWKGDDGMLVLDKQGSGFIVQQATDTANDHSSFMMPAKATYKDGQLILDWSAALPPAWAAIAMKMTVALDGDDDHIVVGWTGGPAALTSQKGHYARVSTEPTDLPQIQGPSQKAPPGSDAFVGTWERSDGKGTGTLSVTDKGSNWFIVQSKYADSAGGRSGGGQNVLHGFDRDGATILAESTFTMEASGYDGELLSMTSGGELVFVDFGITRRFKKVSDTPTQLVGE